LNQRRRTLVGQSPSDPPKDLERRQFLKLGATGVAASLTACATTGVPEPETPAAESTSPPAAPPEAAVPAQAAPPTPEVGDLISPLATPAETWQEPWTWRPQDWPDAKLELNVVENQNPGASPSPGNPTPALFSYNGMSPGPTVRVRSDGTLRVKVRNMLGLNQQDTQVGPAPDPVELTPSMSKKVCASLGQPTVRSGIPQTKERCIGVFVPEELLEVIGGETRPGWSLKGHLNGQHATRVTNLHTHGLHVRPETNDDGSHSDNVLLRILPRADWEARKTSSDSDLRTLGANEHIGQLDYEMRLGWNRNGTRMDHPPGTHWYHPHPHGATHDQVASGMAGFLIVEGDVDEAINREMTRQAWPEPEVKTGPFDYRERLMFIQRVFLGSFDANAGRGRNELRFPPLFAVNGVREAGVMHMRPGAVERWRVLNGSVDGAGTKRFMVLEGQFVQRRGRIWRVVSEGSGRRATRRLEPTSEQDIEDAKVALYQLSFDGLTLVTEKNGEARHALRDLSARNAGTVNPFAMPTEEGEDENKARLRAIEACFKDGEALSRAFVRPNEVYLGNANRSDVLFKAPIDAAGKTFTIFAKEAHIHTDNLQRQLQAKILDGRPFRRPLFDVIVGYIGVQGPPVEGGDFDVMSLSDALPPVPQLLQPVEEEELRVPAAEARRRGVPVGSARTRVVSYSGTGGADFPSVPLPDGYAEAHPELENLVWGVHDGVPVLLPNLTRTMAINPNFDLAENPEPALPRKFMPHDREGSRMLLNTAEEWVLYGTSILMWSHTDRERFPQPGSYGLHYTSHPITRAEGQRRFAEDPEFRITSRGVDHPFHIHINPMWVLRIDIPDENGDLHNILPEPQWMDTVPIPRNGGRVVFRSRFEDFVGTWVHHCHILLHEDLGMMQTVACVDRAEDANYNPRTKVASHDMKASEVDEIYPRPSLELMYKQNMTFIDPNEVGYQVYPGFELEMPYLGEE
jgi:FtsP/CotA-like multicopper oxidase with cupredoxin domain